MIPEIELLLRCARTQLSAEAIERVEQLLQGPLDWDLIQEKGNDHGLVALVARTLLSDSRFQLPPQVRKSLEDTYHQNAERNLALTTELLAILARLEQNGIAAIGYKGSVLAAMAYGDIALRQFCDLDLLVRPPDAEPARVRLIRRSSDSARGRNASIGALEANTSSRQIQDCDFNCIGESCPPITLSILM
jgi:hypothetical protein